MITLSKLAKLAHVSVSTASKAFSGSNEVNKETKEMIFGIAKEQGCFKKFYNVKYPRLVVAVIAPEFDSTYYTRHLSFIQKNLGRENCELCVSTTDFSVEKEEALLEYYYKHSDVDGVIVIGARTEAMESYEIPVVFINPASNPAGGFSVFSNAKPALCESIDYLLSKNVSSVGFIGETLTDKKLELCKQALAEKGVEYKEDYVSISDRRFEEGGYLAMEELFRCGDVPRAVICAYDYMAIGAVRCIYDHGLTVPGDIAILGFDDIPEAKYLNPPLASISTPTEKLCKIASEAIIKQVNGEKAEGCQKALCEFNLRESFIIP